MTRKRLLTSLLLCLALLGAIHPALAQGDPLAKLQKEGWKIAGEGVLQRQPGMNETETFVFGVKGFTWKLGELQRQLQTLREEFLAHPTPELRRVIASHRKAIASTRKMIERARIAEANGDTGIPKSCTYNFTYNADATYKTDVQGTRASASATFSTGAGCGTGEVYAYAFAKATASGGLVTLQETDGPRTGTNVSATAAVSRNGGPDCESNAFASVTSNSLNPTSYTRQKTNAICPSPAPPPQVSITPDVDDEDLRIWEDQCVLVSWTVNISGGTPGYTTKFYLANVLVATGTSYATEICAREWGSLEGVEEFDVTVRADVTDSNGQSKSVSHTTTFDVRYWLY